ncbi:hypothetical protein [Portibacter marinus]|uniref:hypothetical protein n=1 Tax=Portibacter marinus TaxID=2898660 RepID=UPI001F2A9A65|nr:hypothetical protein [Portibacter marinus]
MTKCKRSNAYHWIKSEMTTFSDLINTWNTIKSPIEKFPLQETEVKALIDKHIA